MPGSPADIDARQPSGSVDAARIPAPRGGIGADPPSTQASDSPPPNPPPNPPSDPASDAPPSPASDAPSGPATPAPPIRYGPRAVWPALALYAGIRLTGLLVLWAFASDSGRDLGDVLGGYDAVHYAGIVAHGYDTAIPLKPDGSLAITNLAFFPLYPALMWLLDPVLPGGVQSAGLLLAWSAGLAAAWGLYAVGARLRDRRTGIVLAGLWAVVPHAVVQSMAYTETLFTALAAWSLLAVLQRRWLTAGALCALAGLTRPTGAALAAAVGLAALIAVFQRRDGWRPWLTGVIAPLGLLGWLTWVGLRLDRADGYFHVQNDAWRMSFDGGRETVATARRVITEPQLLAMYVTTLILLLAVALLVLIVLDRVPWPLVIYAGTVVAIVLTGAAYYHAKARLLLPAFPLLLPIAFGLARTRGRTAVVVFAVLAMISSWYGAYLCLDWPISP